MKNFICRNQLCFFISFLLSWTFSAQQTNQNDSNTINVNTGTLVSIFKDIEKQTSFSFAYNNQEIDENQKIQITTSKQKISSFFNFLQTSYQISTNIIGNVVYVTKHKINQKSVPNKITGVVKNTAGELLFGVTVLNKNTNNGVITDLDGTFSMIGVDEKSVLGFSLIGYKSEEINTVLGNFYTVVLEEESNILNEVVITALGIKREEKALGYAVQKVEGTTLETVKGVDVATSLTGKVSGLLVKNSTEFSAEPEISLRGETPLLVIDGIPFGNMSLRDVSSDDIEEISVLKGSTAAALYGYRGENGAIMVTTKKGSKNQGISVSLNSGAMLSSGFLAIPKMQSTFGRLVNSGTNIYNPKGQGSWGPEMAGQNVIQWDPLTKSYQEKPYLPTGKNNFQNFLEQGYVTNNSLSVINQGELGSLRSSVTWVQNKGQYPNSMFDKITYSLGGEMELNKFKLSTNMSYNHQNSPNVGFSGYTGYDPMYNLLVWSSPDYDIRDYKDYWLVENESQNNSYTSTNNNPYFDRYERTHSINRNIFNASLFLEYELAPWLKASLRTGLDTYNNQEEIQISVGSLQGAGVSTVVKGGSQVWGESKKGSYNVGLSKGSSVTSDFILSANKKIKEVVLDGFVGGSIFYMQDEGIEAMTKGGLSIPGYYSLNASVNPASVKSILNKRQVNSVYGRLAASWRNTLFVEGTIRNDWSSTLPSSSRSYMYPSVSTSLVLSELLPKTDWLSFWKVRGSWSTSKTPPGIYSINSVYSVTNSAWGGLNSASYPAIIRGTDVKPQGSTTHEIGTVINFYKSRFEIDATYYEKRSYDFLKQANISSASGFTSNYVNTDEEITRKGVELTASVIPVRTKNWRWEMALNWSKYARYYTKLDAVYSVDQPWVKKGERVDHFVLNDFEKDAQGNVVYSNGLPVYSKYKSLYGYSDPDAIWGMNTSLKYKNFRLSVSVDGRMGGIIASTTEAYMWRSGNHPESVVSERFLDANNPGTSNYVGDGVMVTSGNATYDNYGNIVTDDRVFAPNDVAVTYKEYINRVHKNSAWGGSPSTLDAKDATFFKIRELSLTYDLPTKTSSVIGAKKASVSFIGQNLLLWSKEFKFSDPDGGVENFSDPSVRYVGLNVKATF
ncbi:SusC/RagA family TonB-linked outer membrane protein [Wenyingzhuangia aestuarii]|uniref:SusC/RagA family TonB-linked outer membrane protein n=1 Tax=Wenyingzhuangia aestuarii TaxID=1647582 RepID=UPI001439C155|nr:SusC/RagA family TonB-linked outer membrane protein [Wenyingzhuangia aestuarii]NJB83284.1 TonB-linked SusC/RagA family outer membrane protein [Wenyingzhuangia aestuarii]